MNEQEKKPIALYYDEECTRLIPMRAVEGEIIWVLNFGRVGAGSAKMSSFYVKNLSEGMVENLEVKVTPPEKAGVEAEMFSKEHTAALAPSAVHEVQLKWTAADDVKAGECLGSILIKGMLTIETLYYPK